MKTSHIVAATVGTIAIASVGYALYFDSKRRNDPNFRRKLSMSTWAITAHLVLLSEALCTLFFSLWAIAADLEALFQCTLKLGPFSDLLYSLTTC